MCIHNGYVCSVIIWKLGYCCIIKTYEYLIVFLNIVHSIAIGTTNIIKNLSSCFG